MEIKTQSTKVSVIIPESRKVISSVLGFRFFFFRSTETTEKVFTDTKYVKYLLSSRLCNTVQEFTYLSDVEYGLLTNE